MKKARRHNGDDVKRRMQIVEITDVDRTTPIRKDRIAIPERDLGCPGRYCFSKSDPLSLEGARRSSRCALPFGVPFMESFVELNDELFAAEAMTKS